jgi:hypothetical protein
VTSSIGFIVGFALFGSVTYLPLFLQVAKGASPTASGLQMLPMMGGMLLTSISSGQIISRTGRYKIFPVIGTGVMSLGLFLLSRMTSETSTLAASGIMLVMGLGLGMVMQVLVIAVQNAVEYRDLGVATSGATLFRLIGGSVGTAVLGAIFAARLAGELLRRLPPGSADAPAAGGAIAAQLLASLSPAVRAVYSAAFSSSLSTVFIVATGVAVVGFALTWLLPERPLRATLSADEAKQGHVAGEAFAMPVTPDSLAELRRGLASLADREAQREYMERLAREANVELSPVASWMLVRLEQERRGGPAAIGRAHSLDASSVTAAVAELDAQGLIHVSSMGNGAETSGVTRRGCEVLGRLIAVRRAHVARAAAEWDTDETSADTLRGFERELVPDARPSVDS